MANKEYKAAARYWDEKDAKSIKLDQNQLKTMVEEYILANNTCALATGAGEYVRCTPIEYSWHDGFFWMFSEGGKKFIGLEKNPQVCLSFVAENQAAEDKFTTYFQSASVTGEAAEVTEDQEKILALRALCEKLTPANMTGDNFQRAVAKSLPRTGVWRIAIREAAGKEKSRG